MRSELLINFGSQKVTLSVRLSGTSLSKSLNLCLSLIGLSQVSLRSLCAYFVRQTEPKILRLVSIYNIPSLWRRATKTSAGLG